MVDGPLGKALSARLADKGIIVLGFFDLGFRNVTNSKRPITKGEDLDGLKLRVIPNPVFIETFKTFKANPVPMAFAAEYDMSPEAFWGWFAKSAIALQLVIAVGFVLAMTTVILGAVKALAPPLTPSWPPPPPAASLPAPSLSDGVRRMTFVRGGEVRAVCVPDGELLGAAAALAFGAGPLRLRDASGAVLAPSLPCRVTVGAVEVLDGAAW